MTERVRIKHKIRRLYLFKKACDKAHTIEDVMKYQTYREYIFDGLGIKDIWSPEEGEEVFVTMKDGKKYLYCEDELYSPSEWAAFDEEDNLEEE